MPEEPQPTPESLGWRAGLPDDLKQNDAFKQFKTVGEFGQNYLATAKKVTELEGKIADYVPKLPDNATDADRSAYYDALGRPKQPSEYEFEGEDKNAPEWTNLWKGEFHKLGLTKTQAKALSGAFNGQIQKLVEAANAARQREMTDAEQKLKSEWGDKYQTNVELAKRVYQKHLGNEFDKDFDQGSGATRLSTIRMLVKLAALTGEDRSPQSGNSLPNGKGHAFIDYSKSPAPPQR